MSRKASLSRSPLASATSPIHKLASRFQDYLHFPEPAPLYATMGSLAANMMTGDPVWLMLVGAPSCGKTELLMSLSLIENLIVESSINGVSSLLSGSSPKEYSKGSKGGLLREIGDRGALVFKDFTSVLSMDPKSLGEILSALREIFDQRWSRRVGAEGGRQLVWEGKCAIFGGVTPAIDRSHAMVTEMGERFIFYRYPESDGWAETHKSLEKRDPAKNRAAMKDLVKEFFDATGLGWGQERKVRALRHSEMDRLIAVGQLAARCRGLVLRDTYTKEICHVPSAELPARLTGEFKQLYLGMEFLGVSEEEGLGVIRKIALDCMPVVRSVALKCCMNGKGGKTSPGLVARAGRFSDGTAVRALQELEALEVLDKSETGGFELSERTRDTIKRGWR